MDTALNGVCVHRQLGSTILLHSALGESSWTASTRILFLEKALPKVANRPLPGRSERLRSQTLPVLLGAMLGLVARDFREPLLSRCSRRCVGGGRGIRLVNTRSHGMPKLWAFWCAAQACRPRQCRTICRTEHTKNSNHMRMPCLPPQVTSWKVSIRSSARPCKMRRGTARPSQGCSSGQVIQARSQ